MEDDITRSQNAEDIVASIYEQLDKLSPRRRALAVRLIHALLRSRTINPYPKILRGMRLPQWPLKLPKRYTVILWRSGPSSRMQKANSITTVKRSSIGVLNSVR